MFRFTCNGPPIGPTVHTCSRTQYIVGKQIDWCLRFRYMSLTDCVPGSRHSQRFQWSWEYYYEIVSVISCMPWSAWSSLANSYDPVTFRLKLLQLRWISTHAVSKAHVYMWLYDFAHDDDDGVAWRSPRHGSVQLMSISHHEEQSAPYVCRFQYQRCNTCHARWRLPWDEFHRLTTLNVDKSAMLTSRSHRYASIVNQLDWWSITCALLLVVTCWSEHFSRVC